jgi:hypothetical protein
MNILNMNMIARRPLIRAVLRRRELSTTSSSASDPTVTKTVQAEAPPQHNCDIIQGPSLLRTAVHRPRPALLFLPGLRSLPFWTQWDAKNNTNRVAYQDPAISKVVAHLESNVEAIRSEYHRVATGRKSDYQTDTEHTLHHGQWDWHTHMSKVGAVQWCCCVVVLCCVVFNMT